MMRFAFAVSAVALASMALAGCETTAVGAKPETSAAVTSAPAGPIELGDWQHAAPAAELTQFQQLVAARYGAGLALTAASQDLQHNQFACAPNHDTGRQGDPPVEICRKTVTQAGCTHTWQVHLFDTHGDARLRNARALYDRRCGNDGLLGGPS